MSDAHSHEAALARESRVVERVFAERPRLRGDVYERGRERAHEHARQALAGCTADDERHRTALLVFAAGLFASVREELAAHPRETRLLLADLQARAGLSAMALARELLSAPQAAALSPARAVEAELGLLLGVAPLRGASLWTVDTAGEAQCAHAAGAGASASAARKLAVRLIAGERAQVGARAELFGIALECAERPVAALVARAGPRDREHGRALLAAARPALEAILERDALLRSAAAERAHVETSERRLTRLGFDLHDGPLQELLLLASDLRLFREQLGGVLGTGREEQLLRGRLDDLDARLVALETGLRRISNSVHASLVNSTPLRAAIEDLATGFASRTGIAPTLAFEGDAAALSASQRIALLSVLGEALNNIREHSNAQAVSIDVSLNPAGVQAQVLDDGVGFDVEAALLGAAQRGRIGLAAIHERVRLLGGQCVVESRAGGPTSVSLVLPRWEPQAGGSHGEELVA
jgi:signal transduction histidine kinase